jgi:predicted nucleic acid-binding protein
MKIYVVDASVMLKWVLGQEMEPDQDKANRLLQNWMAGRLELAAPSLWHYEVGNVLGRQLADEADKKMALLFNLHIKSLDPTPNIYAHCFAWMKEFGVTFYDASYLALALELNGALVTADTKFFQQMQSNHRIHLLQEMELGEVSNF